MEIAVEKRSLTTTILNEKQPPPGGILLLVDADNKTASTSGVKICIDDDCNNNMYDDESKTEQSSNESSPTSKVIPGENSSEPTTSNGGVNINNKYLLSSSFGNGCSSTSTSPSISSHSFSSTTSGASTASSSSSASTTSNHSSHHSPMLLSSSNTNTPSSSKLSLSLALSSNNNTNQHLVNNNNNNKTNNNNNQLSEESTTIMNNTDSSPSLEPSAAAAAANAGGFRIIPASISFSTSAYHSSKQHQQEAAHHHSSHLSSDNYSLGTPITPGSDGMPNSATYHHYHPHNHAHRHRHAHHHRNYHGSIRLRNGINDLDESTDDPDSFSIPVLHLSPDDSKYGFDYRLKESNDYDEDELLNIPTTTNNQNSNQHHQLVPDIKESPTETTAMIPSSASSFHQYYPDYTSPEHHDQHYQDEHHHQKQKQQQLGDLQPITDCSTTSRSSFVKSGSIRHHRSTPNLANLDDDSIDLTIENSSKQAVYGVVASIGEKSPLIVTDLNEIKLSTTTSSNLINKNFPSNLELSTNNEHLYNGGLNSLLNNHQSSEHQFDDDVGGCSISGMCGSSKMATVVQNSSSSSSKNTNIINTTNRLHIINNNSSGMSSNSTGGSSLISNAVMVASAMGIGGANAGLGKRVITQRYKLIVEGDVHVCKLPHTRNVFSKILNSKLLRRWKAHRLVLTDTEIYSTTQTDYMDSSIPYHTIVEVSPISKWEPGQKYCLRVATIECHYLIQKHKFKSERVLRSAVRSEVLIKEIKHMIEMSLTTPIEDSEIYQYPLELVSELLQKHQHHLPKTTHEEIIVSLSPLLEKNHPSPEICDFFSRHCRDSPRSHIVIEMFSPVVQRILKHNGDFGRYPRMRLFVQDYLMALCSQNDGLQTVQTFVKSMHSPSSQCPFPRVLPNFVSVCLAAIHGCFEQRKNYKNNQPPAVKLTEQEKEDQLICHTTMMLTMSNFEDWRVNLAQLLQSVPFPDQALTNEKFIKIIKKVIENFAKDPRCEVHQTLLGIREGKEGWFENFCPGNISCDDDGELFSIMLKTLVGCCCKKKRFLLGINKLLSQIMVLAVREVPCCIETLCAMLDLNGVENPENKLQIISTLQSTPLGLKHYAKVCERQMQLRELQQKGGPRKLTLPSRSTDEDLAKLLLSGSFGNLECLSLAFTNVTSACAEYLIKLPSLRYLNLWSTKFGDEGLELISEHLQRLQVLNLCETPVTDKGLSCLASMKQLRKLNLNSTNLSALTFEGLKECLPALQECDIRYTDAW